MILKKENGYENEFRQKNNSTNNFIPRGVGYR